MSLATDLTAVRYYTAGDPYYYTVDNRPLVDLADRDNQLANTLDKRIVPLDITGASTPTTNLLPSGWSVARDGVGTYTITHGMGTSLYSVNGSVINATVGIFFTTAITDNTFSIKTTNSSGTAADMRFSCFVTKF